MGNPIPNQTVPALEKAERKRALEMPIDPEARASREPNTEDMEPAPTMIIIASASTQAAVDLMTKFNHMFGDDARFSIATDGTNAGGWPLTIGFGEAGCRFRADFVEPILKLVAEKMGDVRLDHCCHGEGGPAYKVQSPSWQEVDATNF